MLNKVFTVYDSKVACYMQPFFAQTTASAIRLWSDTCNDEKSIFAKHPADYTLFELGSFDEEKGQFENLSTPLNLGTALQAISQTESLEDYRRAQKRELTSGAPQQ